MKIQQIIKEIRIKLDELEKSLKTLFDERDDWQRFYDSFNVKVDISKVNIPEQKIGFNRLVVVANGLTNEIVAEWCKIKFPCYFYNLKTTDKRTTEKLYAIWVKDTVEADEDMKSKSAEDVKGITTMTLLERMLFELKYFTETGRHLDIYNVTLCSGSRYSDGHVPHADWYSGGFYVDWCRVRSAHPLLRPRVVVS